MLELEPPNRMVWSWSHNDGNPASTVTFELVQENAGTLLRLRHVGEFGAADAGILRDEWLGRIVALAETIGRATSPSPVPVDMNNFNHELVEQFQANAGTIVEGMFKGAPTYPDWYHKVVANPEVTVEVGQDRFQANASTAEGTERDRLYDAQVQMMPGFGFAEYLRAGLRGLLESVLEPVDTC